MTTPSLNERAEAVAAQFTYGAEECAELRDTILAFARDEIRRELGGLREWVTAQRAVSLKWKGQEYSDGEGDGHFNTIAEVDRRLAALKAQSEVGDTGIEPGERP